MSLRENANELAQHGRFGDDRLLHVSEAELRGLASLMPGGKLPINPHTGLPEAFFFLPFLFGAAAPAAAAAGAAAAPALTAGLGAAGAAGAGAAGLSALTAGMQAGLGAAGAAGLGSAIPAATTAATAIPAASTAASLLPGGIGALPSAAISGALPSVGGAMEAATAGLGGLGSSAAPGLASAVAPSLQIAPGAVAPSLAIGEGVPLAQGIGALGSDAALGGAALTNAPAAALPATAPIPTPSPAAALGGSGGTPAALGIQSIGSDAALGGANLTNAAAAPAASTATKGGISSLLGGLGNGNMLQYAAMAAMMMPRGGGGGDKEGKGPDVSKVKYQGGEPTFPTPGDNYSPGMDAEWDYFRNENYNYNNGGIVGYNMGGMVKGYAQGGIADLMPPESPPAPSAKKDQELIEATVAALQGQAGPQGNAIIQQFISTFGEQALQDLIIRLKGAPQAGDGMSDSVPATIDGQQPARLSSGEYIVPADVVSGLGNGSTEAGAQQLNGMGARVRGMRSGGMVSQPPAINPRRAMPA